MPACGHWSQVLVWSLDCRLPPSATVGWRNLIGKSEDLIKGVERGGDERKGEEGDWRGR